eukprot:889393_1
MNYLIKFSPIFVVWPIWLFIVISQNLWQDIFSRYWPLTIGMIGGSFLGGSTPLGGGVIVFPIAVLILNFTATESRDASILVQAVGMSAASFLLITSKSHLLHPTIIYINIIFGCVGMLIASGIHQSADIINLIYTVTLLCFGMIYFYTNFFVKHNLTDTVPPTHRETLNDMFNARYTPRDYVALFLMAVFAIVGGIMTFYIGTGSDIMTFVFGVYVWNTMYPDRRYDDNIFTASTVVVMSVMCTLTVITRAFAPDGFNRDVLLCFGADSFVAVLGAPIGSTVLTPYNLKYLQWLFYLLTILQFILFATLKITDDIFVWIIVCIILGIAVGLLLLHYSITKIINSNEVKAIDPTEKIKLMKSNNEDKFIYIKNIDPAC